MHRVALIGESVRAPAPTREDEDAAVEKIVADWSTRESWDDVYELAAAVRLPPDVVVGILFDRRNRVMWVVDGKTKREIRGRMASVMARRFRVVPPLVRRRVVARGARRAHRTARATSATAPPSGGDGPPPPPIQPLPRCRAPIGGAL